jgi:hypothetical protein
MAIEHAGLPQDSPPSSILFLPFYTNLGDVFVARGKRAIVFDDSDTEWTMGSFAETNAAVLQQQFMSRASNGVHIPVQLPRHRKHRSSTLRRISANADVLRSPASRLGAPSQELLRHD